MLRITFHQVSSPGRHVTPRLSPGSRLSPCSTVPPGDLLRGNPRRTSPGSFRFGQLSKSRIAYIELILPRGLHKQAPRPSPRKLYHESRAIRFSPLAHTYVPSFLLAFFSSLAPQQSTPLQSSPPTIIVTPPSPCPPSENTSRRHRSTTRAPSSTGASPVLPRRPLSSLPAWMPASTRPRHSESRSATPTSSET